MNNNQALQFHNRPSCAVCGHPSMVEVRKIEHFPILQCLKCEFMQTGKILNEESVKDYYEHGYGGVRMRQGQEVNATVNLQILNEIFDFKTGESLLDVGCGYGFFLKKIRDQFSLDVTGVELAESERNYANAELGVNVLASLEDAANSFDYVCMFEVLEHITKPVEFVDTVARLLKPKGRLIIATDNFNSKVVKTMGDKFPKWIPHQHISLFDAKTLPFGINKIPTVKIEQSYSFTPWELSLKAAIFALSGGKRGGTQYSLSRELSTEADRPYPLFGLRKLLNQYWAKWSMRKNLNGEMMYIIAQKID